MSKLVKLKDSKGSNLHINPDHVVIVAGLIDKGQIVIGESNVMLVGGIGLALSGSPEEISYKLNSSGDSPSLVD